MESEVTENRRAFFRLVYPISEQPAIDVEGTRMRVINISEEGVLVASGAIDAELQQQICARIFFSESEPLDIKGKIIRIDESGIAVHLSKGIPMFQIIQEQQRLKQKYMETV